MQAATRADPAGGAAIASLIAAHPVREHLIMSTDKDFYQLLSDRVSVLNTQRGADRRRIHPAEVRDKHGAPPMV